MFCLVLIVQSLAIAAGCGEFTKLIPSKPVDAPEGFSGRDFRSSFQPKELLWTPRTNTYELFREIEAAGEKFQRTGKPATAAQLQAFGALLGAHDGLLPIGSLALAGHRAPQGWLQNLPRLPDLQGLTGDIARFQQETPKLKSDLSAVLDASTQAPLVATTISPIFEHDQETLKKHGFQVYEQPGQVFTGLATRFDEGSRSASDAGIPAAAERPFGSWRLTKAQTVLVYGRSLQPANEFQALMECAKIRLATDQDPTVPLELTWPRMIAQEGGALLEKPRRDLGKTAVTGSSEPSQLRIEWREGVFLASSGTSSSNSPNLVLATAQPRTEALVVREPAAVSLRLSRNLYDGAGNGQHFGIFHEARRFYVFRFQATEVTTTGLEQSLTRFRMPFSSSHLAVSTNRNEFGLWRRALSQQQQDFFVNTSNNPDAAPPEDRWTRTKGIEFFQKDGTPGNPATEAEMAKGALLEIDPEKTANSLESLLLQPPARNSAADSGLVAREKFAVLEELCRKLLD